MLWASTTAKPVASAYLSLLAGNRKALRCIVGWHAWHTVKDAEDASTALQCYRCGLTDASTDNVAVRIGWPGRTPN